MPPRRRLAPARGVSTSSSSEVQSGRTKAAGCAVYAQHEDAPGNPENLELRAEKPEPEQRGRPPYARAAVSVTACAQFATRPARGRWVLWFAAVRRFRDLCTERAGVRFVSGRGVTDLELEAEPGVRARETVQDRRRRVSGSHCQSARKPEQDRRRNSKPESQVFRIKSQRRSPATTPRSMITQRLRARPRENENGSENENENENHRRSPHTRTRETRATTARSHPRGAPGPAQAGHKLYGIPLAPLVIPSLAGPHLSWDADAGGSVILMLATECAIERDAAVDEAGDTRGEMRARDGRSRSALAWIRVRIIMRSGSSEGGESVRGAGGKDGVRWDAGSSSKDERREPAHNGKSERRIRLRRTGKAARALSRKFASSGYTRGQERAPVREKRSLACAGTSGSNEVGRREQTVDKAQGDNVNGPGGEERALREGRDVREGIASEHGKRMTGTKGRVELDYGVRCTVRTLWGAGSIGCFGCAVSGQRSADWWPRQVTARASEEERLWA
ncbi:hypothetical protein C2E23DRAFT_862449 [Lenzites betulinus]|nr:hypothetical protein C2E23DRAFT_862449 [Lenzites betulinus]